MEPWFVAILGCGVLIYLAIGLYVMFRHLRQRGIASPASPSGGAGDIMPFLVVAALWPLYLNSGKSPRKD